MFIMSSYNMFDSLRFIYVGIDNIEKSIRHNI